MVRSSDVHHVTDANLHNHIRLELALTDAEPAVPAFAQNHWAELPDSRLPVEVSLRLLDAVHERWDVVWRSLNDEQFDRHAAVFAARPDDGRSAPAVLRVAFPPSSGADQEPAMYVGRVFRPGAGPHLKMRPACALLWNTRATCSRSSCISPFCCSSSSSSTSCSSGRFALRSVDRTKYA